MTLGDVIKKIVKLLEEYDENGENYTSDQDIEGKIKESIDDIQVELSQIKKIPALLEVELTGENNIIDKPKDMYRIKRIRECKFEVLNNKIKFEDGYKGKINVYYYKFPEVINEDTDNDYVMELERDAIACLVYGVASAILKADVSANYSVYEYKYQEMKQMLSNNVTDGLIEFEVIN